MKWEIWESQSLLNFNLISRQLIMGGDAFKNTVRLSVEEYHRMVSFVCSLLIPLGFEVRAPPEIQDKASFGDVDIYAASTDGLTASESMHLIRNELLLKLESPEDPVSIGGGLSFLSKERYQIDVEVVRKEDLNFHCCVHGNGDFCWILQRSLKLVDLLLTTEGLFIRQHDKKLAKQQSKFFLSNDHELVRDFLGLPACAFDGATSLSSSTLPRITSASIPPGPMSNGRPKLIAKCVPDRGSVQ